MFDSLQRHSETRTPDLQEGHRGHLHVVLLQTEPSGARRGETGVSGSLARSLVFLIPFSLPQIHTSLINGRPGADDLTSELLNFTSARYIRLRLQRIRTLNADLMTLSTRDPRDIDPIVTRRVRRFGRLYNSNALGQLTRVADRQEAAAAVDCSPVQVHVCALRRLLVDAVLPVWSPVLLLHQGHFCWRDVHLLWPRPELPLGPGY